ncbi:hypothetical protein [Bdellovibrio bacteriovorus]|uniref:hypothetical protein n=1 Tax=Bdellovibrio bacteriovorus TaxID=959 RepID=UPI0035A5E5E4
MTKILLVALLLISPFASAKKNKVEQDSLRSRGLLKKISCSYYGSGKTPTGESIGSVDFADPEKTVCDPLSGESSSSPQQGLFGKLIVKSPEMTTPIRSVMDFYNNGLRLEQDLYFADVNVPTRPFTSGFSTQAGDVLVDVSGNKLIENFAIEYTSVLKLSDNDPAGHYEISLLSDDGARLFVKEGDNWNELVNNDGNHPTRLGCPYRTIELKKDSAIPIKILYYQGPRYHIANVMLWKHHKKAHTWKKPASHSLCGVQSNSFFFNPNNGKKQPAMKLLEYMGWNVVAAANFQMPDLKPNPCVEPELAISNFKFASVSAPTAQITWSTNLPASSQLYIVNIFTGEEMYTTLDSELVTSHVAVLDGLIHGLQYQIQAISIDAKGKEVRSQPLILLP